MERQALLLKALLCLSSKIEKTFSEGKMASTTTLEGAKQAVFFPFRGKRWGVKLLIGAALGFASFFIPIVPLIPLEGYYARIMKRVIVEGEDPELPEWNDWGGLFLDGVKLWGASILYMLPSLLLIIGGYVLFFVLDLATVLTSINIDSYSATSFPPMYLGSMFGMFGGLALIFLGSLLSLVTTILLPPALGNLIAKGDFSAAFRIKEWWPVFKANLSGYLLALAITVGMYSLMLISVYILYFTFVLCILIPIAVCVVIYLLGAMAFSLYAVTYRDSVRKLEAKQANSEPAQAT